MHGLYDPIAQSYDQQTSPHHELWERLSLASVASLLPPEPIHVLDAGAGTGKMSLHFLRAGHRVTLLDPSEAMLDVARDKITSAGFSNVEFVVGRLESIPFPEAAFDLVFSDGDPLCYCIGSQQEAADEILRVLRPGGSFHVSCDNRWSAVLALLLQGDVDAALQCATSGRSTDPYGHPVHAFDPSELAALFRQAGAVEVEVAGKGHLSTFVQPARLEELLREGSGASALEMMETRLSKDPLLAAMAAHLQVTGRKAGGA